MNGNTNYNRKNNCGTSSNSTFTIDSTQHLLDQIDRIPRDLQAQLPSPRDGVEVPLNDQGDAMINHPIHEY